MSRTNNKIYNNTDSNSNLPRRFVSPKTAKTQKIEQYRSADRDTQSYKSKEDNIQRTQKHRAQNSGDTPSSSRSNIQKDKSNSHQNTDRPRTNEKKDYMASNLARFNRKKQQKITSSNASEKSNPNPSSNPTHTSRQKKQRYIYTFKEEIQSKSNQVREEYPAMPSSIQNKEDPSERSVSQMAGMLQEVADRDRAQSGRSEIRDNSTSILSPKSGKQIEINVVKYQDRNNFKKQTKEGSFRQMSATQAQQKQQNLNRHLQTYKNQEYLNKRENQKEPLSFKDSLHQPEMSQQPQYFPTKASQDDTSLLIQRLQTQKSSLQESNTRLFQQNLQLSGQVTILEHKCQSLEQQLAILHETSSRNIKQTQRMTQNNQKMFQELELRYNSLLIEFRNKTRMVNQMNGDVMQRQRRAEDYANALRSVEEEVKNRQMEIQRIKKIYQARIVQLQQDHEFQLKQIQIKSKERSQRQEKMEAIIKNLQKELNAKQKQAQINNRKIEQMGLYMRDRDELQGLIQVKQTENTQLKAQLKKTKDLLQQTNIEMADSLHRMALEIKQKEKHIKDLTNNISQMISKQKMQAKSRSAQSQLYSRSQNGDSGGFQDFIRSQSAETNRLRADLSSCQQQIFRVTTQRDELRQKLRRAEQQLQLSSRTHASNIANLTQVKQATQLMLKKRIAALQALRNIH